jgi:hypothetical protein
MPQKTITDLIPDATVTAEGITIPFTALGYSQNTSADKFVAAVIIAAKALLTRSQYDSEYEQNIYVEDGFDSFETRTDPADNTDKRFQIKQLTVNLAKLDLATLNPEDY